MANSTVDKRVFDELARKVAGAKDAHVKVGVLASQGGGNDVGGITLVELAAVHEYGSPAAGVPQRSFLRSTFARRDVADALEKQLARLARGLIAEKLDLDKALDQLGAWAAAQVKRTIKERLTEGPENQALKPATVAKKGSSLPLVDTGQLLNSITWERAK